MKKASLVFLTCKIVSPLNMIICKIICDMTTQYIVSQQPIVLPSRLRWTYPSTPFPRILRQINKCASKHAGEIELFDIDDPDWDDLDRIVNDELSSLSFYNTYIDSLLDDNGPGYPDYIEVAYINEHVNCGVFASKEIPQGEFIGIYTGELKYGDYDDQEESAYLFELLDEVVYAEAKSYGNFTRFINHSPEDHANVHSMIYLYDLLKFQRVFTIPIIIFYAKTAISRGDQLLYDYGKDYWTTLDAQPTAMMPHTFRLN